MKIPSLLLAAASLLILVLAPRVDSQTAGVLFTVDATADASDANVGDRLCADAAGRCTLRAAIQEANANPSGRDIIIFALPQPSVISLTQGPLTVSGHNISIVGPGARRLTIQRDAAAPQSRVFSVSGSNLVLRGVTIRNGSGDHLTSGGALSIAPSSGVYLSEVSLVDNTSAWTGGAVFNAGNVTIMRSLIAGNSAFSGGGAIRNEKGAVLRVINSTITNNHCAAQCGAVSNAGSLTLVNDTISHNTSLGGLHGIVNTGSAITVLNTIIGPDSGPEPSLSGAFNSLGNNIVTDARGATGFTAGANNDQVSDNDAINPLLGELADNGGQTDTRELLPGSPAINMANNCVWNGNCGLPLGSPFMRLVWDQRRGFLRGGILNTVDIGAFELSTGSGSVISGSFVPLLPQPTARYLNSIAVFTNTATNAKTFRPINAAGRFRPPSLGSDVYVLEIKTKRAPGFAPFLLAGPD